MNAQQYTPYLPVAIPHLLALVPVDTTSRPVVIVASTLAIRLLAGIYFQLFIGEVDVD